MKKTICFIALLCGLMVVGQGPSEEARIQNIKNNLEALAVDNSELTENLKLDINVSNTSLANFLIAVGKVHKLNISVDPSLQGITVANNFPNVTVADLLVFVCKEYTLDIEFTGNIISVSSYSPPPPPVIEKEIVVAYDPLNDLISMDLKNDPLEKVFRKVIDATGQNLLFNNGMETIPLNLYINNVPFDLAMEKLAELNNLTISKSRDGFFLFNAVPTDGIADGNPINGRPQRRPGSGSNYSYQVIDTTSRLLNVDFENVAIADIINDLSYDLDLDVYTATPLDEAGMVTFRAKQIYFDNLLERIFEASITETSGQNTTSGNGNTRNQNQNRSQNTGANNGNTSFAAPTNFSFKKEDDVYYFGTADQLSVRKIEVIQLMHRSIELLGDPNQAAGGRSAGRTVNGNINYLGGGTSGGFQNNQGFGNNQGVQNRGGNNSRRLNTQSNNFGGYSKYQSV